MIKGLAITPPILGRISIGRVVEKNGKRLHKKIGKAAPSPHPQIRIGHWTALPDRLTDAQHDLL